MRKLKSVKEIEKFPIYDITVEKDHCFKLYNDVVAHNSMYSKEVVGGGTGTIYGADNIYIIGRQQEKEGVDVVGYKFVLNVEKSRFIREKSKIPVDVTFEGGINKYSGLIDLAIELGFVVKPKNGWYAKVNQQTGEVSENNFRLSQTYSDEFWNDILDDESFLQKVKEKYQYKDQKILTENEVDMEEVYEDVDKDATGL